MGNDSNNDNSGNNNKKTQLPKTTGINFFDRLIAEDRNLALANAKRHWNSFSQAQKVDHMNLLYDMVREKMVRHSGMISHGDAIREFF